MQYWTCPLCGANLDSGEKCDCGEEEKRKQERIERLYKQETGSNQLTFNWAPERLNA